MLRSLTAAIMAALSLTTASSPMTASASAAPSQWLLLSGHNHSHDSNEYSHDPDHAPSHEAFNGSGVASLGALVERHGMDGVVLTDHNTIKGCHDPNFGKGKLTWFCGEELTAGSAHATVIFPDVPDLLPGGGEPFHPYHMQQKFCTRNKCLEHKVGVSWNLPREGMQALVNDLQHRGAFIVANHPRAGLPPTLAASLFPSRPQARTMASWSWPYAASLGVEGMEIGLPMVSRQKASLVYWDSHLMRGIRLTGVAGTDYHHGSGIGARFTGVQHWVMALPIAPDKLPASLAERRRLILEHMRRGRVQVLANAAIQTRVNLNLLVQDRRYEVGDTVDLGEAGRADGILKIAVTSPRGGKLRLVRNGKVWGDPIPLPNAPNVTITRAVPLQDRGYIRAEVYGMPGSTTASDVLTNPVYWTRQIASVRATVVGDAISVSYRVPRGHTAAVFLTRAGVVPYGASDPAIVARQVAPAAHTFSRVTLTAPGPGAYSVSLLPVNADGEIANYRLPATATVQVNDQPISTRTGEPGLEATP